MNELSEYEDKWYWEDPYWEDKSIEY